MAYRLGFVLEQTLGHVTHAKNLQQSIAMDADVIPTVIPITFDIQDRWDKVPIVKNNWTLRASLRARDQIQMTLRKTKLDGLFFHTSVTALFARDVMKEIPTVVSMDATPLNFDDIGDSYNHRPSRFTPVESFKNSLNRGTFDHARKLIIWAQWGKNSLVKDYSVESNKIEVIPPGVDLEKWKSVRGVTPQKPVRLLFVGGDFRRKGGETLLKAFRTSLMQDCELDIVTRDQVDIQGLSGVRVHRLDSNAPELMALYARADIFTFPTQADVLPIAIMEGFASGLPTITTAVGGICEQVEDGVTGYLIPQGDADALAEATLRLVRDPNLRRDMSAAARRAAEQKYDAAKNYASVLAVCKKCVDDG